MKGAARPGSAPFTDTTTNQSTAADSTLSGEFLRALAYGRPLAGVVRGAENSEESFRSCFEAGLRALIATGRPFSVADLKDLGLPPADHPCRVGSLLAAAQRTGRIRQVGTALDLHTGRPVLTWLGVDDE